MDANDYECNHKDNDDLKASIEEFFQELCHQKQAAENAHAKFLHFQHLCQQATKDGKCNCQAAEEAECNCLAEAQAQFLHHHQQLYYLMNK
jgi:hypothetical protein